MESGVGPARGEVVGLREAAARLGVHYMTAYRYVRSGRLDAHKLGAEWMVPVAALEGFVPGRPSRGATGPDADAADAVAAPREVFRGRLESRLIAGDEAGAWGVVESAQSSGATPSEVLTEMLAPALRSIGQRWADGELAIADEHRASAVSQRLISRLGPRLSRPGRRRGRVVLGSVAGDHHTLPTAIMSDLLRGAGLEVLDLGADCPAESFVDTVAAGEPPAAVGLCVTAPEALDSVPAATAALRRGAPGCPVVVGGGAVTSAEHAARLGADHWAGHPDEVVELFLGLAAAARSLPSPADRE